MEASTHAHVTFFLTGSRDSAHLQAVEGLGLRPALLARHHDLAALRERLQREQDGRRQRQTTTR